MDFFRGWRDFEWPDIGSRFARESRRYFGLNYQFGSSDNRKWNDNVAIGFYHSWEHWIRTVYWENRFEFAHCLLQRAGEPVRNRTSSRSNRIPPGCRGSSYHRANYYSGKHFGKYCFQVPRKSGFYSIGFLRSDSHKRQNLEAREGLCQGVHFN